MSRKRLQYAAEEVAARVVEGERKPGDNRRRRVSLIRHAARRYKVNQTRLRWKVDDLLLELKGISQ